MDENHLDTPCIYICWILHHLFSLRLKAQDATGTEAVNLSRHFIYKCWNICWTTKISTNSHCFKLSLNILDLTDNFGVYCKSFSTTKTTISMGCVFSAVYVCLCVKLHACSNVSECVMDQSLFFR